MNLDPNIKACLKPFIPYDRQDYEAFNRGYGLGNSCWIDSLFVALFHTIKRSIDKFVNNLKIKKYVNIPDNDKKNIEIYEKQIIENIINIYHIINIDTETDDKFKKVSVCNNMRKTLENHRKILIKNNIITKGKFFSFIGANTSYELLKYLKEYVLDTKCFDSILLHEIILFDNETLKNKFDLLDYKNINFINIKYGLHQVNTLYPDRRSHFFTDSNKINDNLFDYHLHSIIIHDGTHYTCYYKCLDKWYFYNDIIKSKERSRLFGSGILDDVMKDHNLRFDKFEGNYEMTLLYLKNDEQDNSLATKTNKIQKLKELIDEHFDRLKKLL